MVIGRDGNSAKWEFGDMGIRRNGIRRDAWEFAEMGIRWDENSARWNSAIWEFGELGIRWDGLGDMGIRRDGNLSIWEFGEMGIRRDGNSARCEFGDMGIRRYVNSVRWEFSEMGIRRDGNSARWEFGEMGANVTGQTADVTYVIVVGVMSVSVFGDFNLNLGKTRQHIVSWPLRPATIYIAWLIQELIDFCAISEQVFNFSLEMCSPISPDWRLSPMSK